MSLRILNNEVTLQVIATVHFDAIVIDSEVFVGLRLRIGSLADSLLHLVVDKPDTFPVNEVAGFVTHALSSLIRLNHEVTIPIKRTRHFVSVLVVAVKLIRLWEHVGSFLDACSHIFVFNAHSLRIEHETGSVTATMNVSIVDVDDKLAFSVISTIHTVSMLIYAVEFVLSRRIVFIVTVFRALIAGTTQFTLLIIA